MKKQQLIQQHQARADLDKPVTPREQAVVNAPSLEEQRKHALTHLPYASWCPHCVSFRAKADRRLKITEDHRAVSTFAYDFCYTGRASDPEQKLTCLIMVDKHTKYVEALPVPAKGGTEAFKYMCAEVVRVLNFLGHKEVTLRCDPEPSTLALQSGMTQMGLRANLEQTGENEHQSNPSEQTVDSIRQMAGTLLSDFEAQTGLKVKTLDPLHAWAWRHAAWILQRYNRNQGTTAFERIADRPYMGKVVCFGEAVYVRVKSSVKGKPRWIKALWLGKTAAADLHLVVTSGGFLVTSRSVRRTVSRYDPSLCSALRDFPWMQSGFLAGRGHARNQKTAAPVEAEAPPQPVGSGRQELVGDEALLSELVPRGRNARTPEPNGCNVPPLTDEAASDPPSDSGSWLWMSSLRHCHLQEPEQGRRLMCPQFLWQLRPLPLQMWKQLLRPLLPMSLPVGSRRGHT